MKGEPPKFCRQIRIVEFPPISMCNFNIHECCFSIKAGTPLLFCRQRPSYFAQIAAKVRFLGRIASISSQIPYNFNGKSYFRRDLCRKQHPFLRGRFMWPSLPQPFRRLKKEKVKDGYYFCIPCNWQRQCSKGQSCHN